MATTHDCTFKVSLASFLQNVGDLDTGESRTNFTYKKHFETGSGADQSDQFYSDSGECANATDTIDLAGSVTNKYGESITATKLKGFIIVAGAANTVDIEVTQPAAGFPWCKAATDAVLLKPGGLLAYVAPAAAGVAITAGATDTITLTAAAGTATYDILFWLVE